MKDRKKIEPPVWAQRLLTWYCKPTLLEDLQGDLNEYFRRNVETKGNTRAKLIYIADVLKFLRPYTLRRPDSSNILTHGIMINSYIKTSGRNIVRNKLFSTINIEGLAISMSVGLLIIGMLNDAISYDKFHENHDRIYRLISQRQYMENKDDDFFATTSLTAAKAVKESFPGQEDVAVLQRSFSGDVSVKDTTIPLSGFWANASVLNVFSFPLLQGDAATALKAPFSLLLTEEAARKLFNDTNVVGRTVVVNNDREYTITGILEDIPVFSHVQFDMLASLSTREIVEKDNVHGSNWNNMWDTWVYILMQENTDLATFHENLDKLSERENNSIAPTNIKLALQPLDDIMTGENLSNQIGPTIGGTTVWILGSLSLIVILTACFNYTNLSMARSFRRSREVGIRKTIGALKGHVVNQFIVESVIIALLALVFSLLLFQLIKPHFISMEPSLQQLLVLDLSPWLILLFIAFALIVGVAAGLFPALFFARINAIHVLKNISAIPMLRSVTLRKVLIVFQYVISIMAITATLVLYKQYSHFITYDLGFTTENILNIRLQDNKAAILKKELAELPEVKAISQSALITSLGSYWSLTMKHPNNPEDSASVYYNIIDENYLPLHGHNLIAGRSFIARPDSVEEAEVIVNEQVLKRFNIAEQNTAKAIDEVILVNGKKLTIIGVMKDFEYGKANNNTSNEVIMRYSNDPAHYLNVKIVSTNWPETYAKIETIWKKIDPVHGLDAKFYDEQIEEAFIGLRASLKVGGFLSFLVICIASIGLLGMVVFTTETRLKEISIRKVLGASEPRLLYLLSKGFMLLLTIAAAIAMPVTYIIFEQVFLPKIANHAPLANEMIAGVLGVMLVAIAMITSQTLKASRANPAEVLKTEQGQSRKI